MDEKKKSKLKQLLGSDFEVLRDLESLDIKKKEKIQKLLGINVDALEEVTNYKLVYFLEF